MQCRARGSDPSGGVLEDVGEVVVFVQYRVDLAGQCPGPQAPEITEDVVVVDEDRAQGGHGAPRDRGVPPSPDVFEELAERGSPAPGCLGIGSTTPTSG